MPVLSLEKARAENLLSRANILIACTAPGPASNLFVEDEPATLRVVSSQLHRISHTPIDAWSMPLWYAHKLADEPFYDNADFSDPEFLKKPFNLPPQPAWCDSVSASGDGAQLILHLTDRFCIFDMASRKVIGNPSITIINYHNSFLPQHRGMHAEAWAIFEGDAQSGVTWHIVDNGIDTGNIICQECVQITEEITSIKLLWRQSIAAIELLEQHLNDILANRYKVFPNDVQKNTSFHYKKDIPGDGYLDTAWSNEKIWRFLRAMDYGPYNNLGLPRLKIGTNVYSWHGYSREKKKTNIKTNKIVHSNGNIIINNNYSLHDVFKVCKN